MGLLFFKRNRGLVKVVGKMKADQYLTIIRNNICQSTHELNIGHNWVFQLDNDPKHTAIAVTKWFADSDINVMNWPSQCPHLNPIENLWTALKKTDSSCKLKNMKELEQVAKGEWRQIPIVNYKKRLNEVSNKGHPIDY